MLYVAGDEIGIGCGDQLITGTVQRKHRHGDICKHGPDVQLFDAFEKRGATTDAGGEADIPSPPAGEVGVPGTAGSESGQRFVEEHAAVELGAPVVDERVGVGTEQFERGERRVGDNRPNPL